MPPAGQRTVLVLEAECLVAGVDFDDNEDGGPRTMEVDGASCCHSRLIASNVAMSDALDVIDDEVTEEVDVEDGGDLVADDVVIEEVSNEARRVDDDDDAVPIAGLAPGEDALLGAGVDGVPVAVVEALSHAWDDPEIVLDSADLAVAMDEDDARGTFEVFAPPDQGPDDGEHAGDCSFASRRSAEACDLGGLYIQNALEYLTGSDKSSTGLHVLVSSLSHLNTRRNLPSEWVRTFVTTVTSRLPEVQDVGDYLEAYAFVQHFPKYANGHYPGCMLVRMYSKSTMPRGSNGFVAFQRYVQDVLNDPYSSRSHDPSWAAFAFNVMLMRLLGRGPSVTLVKRGLQAALQDYNSQKEYSERFGDQVLPGFMYDRQEAQRNVDLLCAAVRKWGPMTYFGTFTCNALHFPGVREVYRRLHRKRMDPRLFAVHMQRAWYRASQAFMRLIREDPAKPLGNVVHMLAHAEWQTDSPNFNHWHLGIWTDDPINSLDPLEREAALGRVRARLTATIQGAFAGMGTLDEVAYWESGAWQVQVHTHNDRCQVPDGQGGYKCRHGIPYPLHAGSKYRPIHADVPESMQDLLLEEGLASWNSSGSGVCLIPELCGGWHDLHRWTDNGFTSSFSPHLFVAAGCSHQNWQVVSATRFLLAYLVKYLSSEEERCVVRLTQQGPTTVTARTADEHQRKRRLGLKLARKAHGRVIGLPVIIFYDLGYSSVFHTFEGIRVNTRAPEGRFTVLRRGWRPREKTSPMFGVREEHEDQTRCGVDCDGVARFPEREPTDDQQLAWEEWANDHTTPDCILKYCVRPPETLDLTLREYYEWFVPTKRSLSAKDAVKLREKVVDWFANGFFDLRYAQFKLHWEIFICGDRWRSAFGRLQDIRAREAIAQAAINPALRAPWMANVVDRDAPPRVMIENRYLPGLNANRLSQTMIREAGPFGHEGRMRAQWMQRHHPTANPLDLGVALEALLRGVSVQKWVRQELAFWPVGSSTMFRYIREVWEAKRGTHHVQMCIPLTEEEFADEHQQRYDALLDSVQDRHEAALRQLPVWGRTVGQTPRSWREQDAAYTLVVERLHDTVNTVASLDPWERVAEGLSYVRPLYTDGPPGTGKTYILRHVARYLREHTNVSDGQ